MTTEARRIASDLIENKHILFAQRKTWLVLKILPNS